MQGFKIQFKEVEIPSFIRWKPTLKVLGAATIMIECGWELATATTTLLFIPNNFASDLEVTKINKVEYRLPKITIGARKVGLESFMSSLVSFQT